MTVVLPISRYNSLVYDITLEQTNAATGVTSPLTIGTVTAAVSPWPPAVNTLLPNTSVVLQHVGNGRWMGEVSAAIMQSALTSYANNAPLAVLYFVEGVMVRYREAIAANILRVEALG